MNNYIYSDLDFFLEISDEGNIKKKYDKDAIIQSVKTIISTGKGERVMNPEFGSNVKYELFEPLDSFGASYIANDIKEALARWEDRIILTSVNVEPYYDKNLYIVTIDFQLVERQIQDNITFGLRSLS